MYTAATIEAAELALAQFEQNWASRYPMSVASWHNHWYELTTFSSPGRVAPDRLHDECDRKPAFADAEEHRYP